jgi:hypothetical protein
VAINSWYGPLTGDAWRRWLEGVGTENQVSYRYIDPFDTSRRDFKEVPALLQGVADNGELPERGPGGNQNVTDMKKAKLCDGAGRTSMALTALGMRVLDAWQRAGVTSATESQELGRYVIVILSARLVTDQDPAASTFYASSLSCFERTPSSLARLQSLRCRGRTTRATAAIARDKSTNSYCWDKTPDPESRWAVSATGGA